MELEEERTVPFYNLVGKAGEHWKLRTDISPEMESVLANGVRDMPIIRVLGLPEMTPVPQDARSIESGEADLRKGLLPEN